MQVDCTTTKGGIVKAFRYLILLGVVAFMFSGVASADWLYAPDCTGNCFGSNFLLQYNPTPVDTIGSTNVWEVFLTVDATNYVGPATYIRDVAFKIAAPPVDLDNSALIAAPGILSNWTLALGNAGNSDCNGAGNGFLCAQDGTSAPVGAMHTWQFWYATANPLQTGNLEASIQIKFDNASGTLNGNIVSEGITLQAVPDGGVTLMLLGGALVGLETLRRRFCA